MEELSPTTRSSRHTRWWVRYDRVAAVATRLGRLPRRSDVGVLSADVAWLANQRRAHNLSPEQWDALAALPGWSEHSRSDHWLARADELRRFIRTQGRAPRVNGPLPGESALAHWFSRQRVALRDGRLSRSRTEALNYATRDLP